MKISPLVIILIVVLGLILFLPQISDSFNVPQVSGDALATGGIGMEIHYKDGESKDFRAEALTIIPMTILDDASHEIDFILTYVYATIEYTGTLTEYGWKGRFYGIIRQATKIGDVFEDVDPDWIKGSNWESGAEVQLMAHQITAQDLESVLENADADSGSYRLYLYGSNIDFYLDFADGTHAEKLNHSNEATWDFTYEKAIQSTFHSLAITVTRNIYK